MMNVVSNTHSYSLSDTDHSVRDSGSTLLSAVAQPEVGSIPSPAIPMLFDRIMKLNIALKYFRVYIGRRKLVFFDFFISLLDDLPACRF